MFYRCLKPRDESRNSALEGRFTKYAISIQKLLILCHFSKNNYFSLDLGG